MSTFLDDRQVVNRAPLSQLGNTANLTLDVIMGDINTFFANATFLPTASVLMTRDANANTQANNFLAGFVSTATAATTTTLTVASKEFQQFTGTTTQTVVLPAANTLTLGQSFVIANRSTGNITVQNGTPTTIQTMTANSQAVFTVSNIGSIAGTWDISYTVTGPQTFLQTQVTTDSTTTGSAATLLSTDILVGNVRLTNGSLVSVSGIPAGVAGQQIVVENQTGNTITINNNDAGATAANRIFTGTGGAAQMAANASFAFVYDITTARWMLVGGTGSGSGSGSGKNYLSVYTASTSSGVPNTGNGNFELGSTAGWALGTIGTLTNGLPTGSPTFGSGASGNLSISTVSGGTQIGGSYSLSYASSAATTQGNMVASNAFFIDAEDQGKVLTVKFYYQIASGAANDNFSGTSSNSFGWAIYDVTNSNWIGTAGQFGMTQNSGVGYVTGTFQTAINTAQLILCIYNVNATTGATTLYFDDISVGPQTAPSGPAVTDWVAYTPTITGFGTPTTVKFYSRRVGDSLEVQGSFTSGTTTAALAQVTLGYNGGNANVTIDSNKLSNLTLVGPAIQSLSSSTFFGVDILGVGGNDFVSFSVQTSSAGAGTPAIGTSVAANGTGVAFNVKVPITGWSSNTSMSSDTDTRVVAVDVTGSSTTIGTGVTALTPTTITKDTHGAFSGSTYTVPVTGWYRGDVYVQGTTSSYIANTGFLSAYIIQNGTGIQVGKMNAQTTASLLLACSGGTTIFCNAGDTLQFGALSTVSTGATALTGSFHRLSGPSVIAATESVNGRVFGSTTIPTSGGAVVVWSNKSFDSHNAFNSTTLTIPVSGKYQFNVQASIASTWTAGDAYSVSLVKNSSAITYVQGEAFNPGNYIASGLMLSDIISCNAGDTIQIFVASNGGGSPSIQFSPFFSWARVGN